MKQKRLCFNCFKQDHVAKFCRKVKACTVEGCQGKYQEGCTTKRSYRTFLNVVPVKVRAGNKTNYLCIRLFLGWSIIGWSAYSK